MLRLVIISFLIFFCGNTFAQNINDISKYKVIPKLPTLNKQEPKQFEIYKLDSNYRFLNRGKSHYDFIKIPFKTQIQLVDYKLKPTILDKQMPKVDIKKKITGKKVFAFSTEIRSESYFTTAQNPLMRNEPYYSRLYIAPTITLLGLPFKGNIFLTTENNNTYKNDFFSFRFDANAYRQIAAKEMQNQINEAKKLDRLRANEIQKNGIDLNRLENESNKLKSQIPNVDSIQKQLKTQAEAKSKALIEEQEQKAKEKLKNASEDEKKKIENQLKHNKDSILQHYQKQANDSFLNSKDKLANKVDSAKLARYLKTQEKLEELKLKKQKLEQLRNEDSAKIAQKISQARNPDDLKEFAKTQMKGNKFMQQVLSIDRFGIGIVNPQYSENTLYAISVKGLDIGVNQKNYFYDLTIGKTTPQFLGMFSDQAPEYTRNIAVARVGLGELKKDHVGIEVLHAYDPENQEASVTPVRNTVYNLIGQFTFLKNTTVQSQFAQSSYKELNTYKVLNEDKKSNKFNASVFQSYYIKAIHSLGDNTKAELILRQTGLGFRNIGNPFLRRNFRELESKVEHQMFKKQVKIQASYKEMKDNITEIGPSTNRLKGYGLKIATSFSRYPNLTLSYSPYQQGNNHPDSIFRSNNQFSITSAIITYKKKYKSINWMGLFSYMRSAMELNETGLVAYKMYNTMHTFQIGNRQTLVLAIMKNNTAPFVDSLNSNSYQATYTTMVSNKLSIGGLGEYSKFKNNAFKAGCGVQINSQLYKNFSIGLMTRYDRIHGIWNLQNANVFTGRLMAVWRW